MCNGGRKQEEFLFEVFIQSIPCVSELDNCTTIVDGFRILQLTTVVCLLLLLYQTESPACFQD